MKNAPAPSLDDLPGPRRLPLLGNMHQLRRTARFHLTLEEWAGRYGPVYRMDIGPVRHVVISDRETVNTVLRQRPERYRRWSNMAEILDELALSGVFSAEGEDWRRQRRLAVTALNADHLHRYHHVVADSVGRLHGRLRTIATEGGPPDLLPVFQSFTTEVISTLAFAQRPDLLGSGHDHLQPHIARLFARAAVRVKAPFPYWRRVKLPADRALDRSMQVLHAAVGDLIAAARERRAAQPDHESATFLEGMIACPENYSDAEIAANALTMLLAGEDTTANSLGWAVWYAATRPDVQDRLRTEALAVLGEHPVADHPAALRLEYADAVVREAIRLHSPATFIGLEPTEDVELLGHRVPAGTRLALLTRWISVTDEGSPRPREFDPDRWLGDSIEAKGFLPFGAGPRVCPGRGLAYLEAKTALAMLVHAFDLSSDPASPPPTERFGFAIRASAIPVLLRERADTARSAVPTAVETR